MNYRIVKRCDWWTNIFTTGLPQYLYFDFDLEHFEVGGYTLARKHKWIFTKEEVKAMQKEPGFENEFFVEEVGHKKGKAYGL